MRNRIRLVLIAVNEMSFFLVLEMNGIARLFVVINALFGT